ncbi:hypothetical protein, partial [Pseudomonas syringae]|uniref:hypothetical protein n=1 Tax=Pseudomonas syringae TaxID=317 RepID=UPI001C1F5E24
MRAVSCPIGHLLCLISKPFNILKHFGMGCANVCDQQYAPTKRSFNATAAIHSIRNALKIPHASVFRRRCGVAMHQRPGTAPAAED